MSVVVFMLPDGKVHALAVLPRAPLTEVKALADHLVIDRFGVVRFGVVRFGLVFWVGGFMASALSDKGMGISDHLGIEPR